MITLSKPVAVLLVLLALALVAVAVLVTLVVAGGDSPASPASPASSASPEAAVSPSPTSTPTLEPTPSPPTAAPPTSTVAATSPASDPPTPTATVPIPVTQAVAPTPIPPTSTPAPRYASVEARSYFDAYLVALEAAEALGIKTYEAALASDDWYEKTKAVERTLLDLRNFVAGLPYDDACRRTLALLGGRGSTYYWYLTGAVRDDPFGIVRRGPKTWDEAIAYHRADYGQAHRDAFHACVY